MVADIDELEEVDASELHARRLDAKEVLTPMKGANFIFPVADGTVKTSGGDQCLRTSTLIRDSPDRGQEQNNLRRESEGSSSTPRGDSSYDGEAKDVFWSISGDFIYRHHEEPGVKLHVPTEESFPVPLKYIDVTRTADTTFDVMLEKSVDDCWHVDGARELSDTWTGFTRFTNIERKATGWIHMVPGRDWQENKRPQGPRNYGQRRGNTSLMHQNVKRSTSGLLRNQSSTMPED